jgi:nitrite reductase (cytochrome c-552)
MEPTPTPAPAAPPPPPAPPPPRGRPWAYLVVVAVTALATAGVVALLMNIFQRQQEGQAHFFKVVDLTEDTIDPEVWGRNFPRQYSTYLRTVDVERTRHGGSEAFDKLEQDPRLKLLFAGYAFSLDFREERGHAYMLKDQEETLRVKLRKQPGACLHCHASVLPAYRKAGGGSDWASVRKGFEVVCAMDWKEARPLVTHPVSCVDCHDPKTTQLRVTRPAFLLGIAELARSKYPLPHLASIERWRQGSRTKPYDPNLEATRQEMRSFVCGQCHVEYYFKGEGKLLTYPWHKGLKAEQMESHYDEEKFADWTHEVTKAPMLKAQHPEFETWNQGIHARSGVACADCHMPYVREGAVKVSDHHVRSPLLNIARACQTCHRYPEKELLARAEGIQDRTKALLDRAEDAVVELIVALREAQKKGVAADRLEEARKMHRRSQWRVDLISSENSMGFHAAQECARVLAEAIDYARQGQLALAGARQPLPAGEGLVPRPPFRPKK